VTVQRYLVLAFLFGALCVGVTMRSAVVNVFGVAGIPDYLIGPFSLSVVAAFGSAILTFFILMRHRTAVTFSTEVIREMYKVTWPDREETMRSTTVVVLSAVGSAAFLAFCDYIWAQVTDVIIFTTG